ncbi:MAG: HD domain-containing protein, partial [Thermoplasmata archaeon]|nr:HD domain-containing protein [Thermoplasmata archaeon]NIS10353.1 HD domain-containing protein [Thermoplasmata archaeon]NIS18346.1 HD domain-containing protein [Thermoplasmata archaeon]NIT75320.1 HD domain-containing protein [Thermoplasmata archaeon]NIU47501.1 HD domain-containing protein [Thermoplasmata archaeon]
MTAGALLHELGAGWRKDMGYIMAGVGLAHRLGLDPRLIEII